MNNRHHVWPIAFLPMIAAALISAFASTRASQAGDTSTARAPAKAAAVVGSALPGGAVISARLVTVTPVTGGPSVAAPIAGDGSFSFAGLRPGKYRLALASDDSGPRQTQGATFGEKVNAGVHAAGGAMSQGVEVSKHDTAMNSVGNIRAREMAPGTISPATGAPAAAAGPSFPSPVAASTKEATAAAVASSTAGSSTSSQAVQKDNINGGMPNRISMNVTVAKQAQRIDVDGSPIEVAVAADGMLTGRATLAP